MKDIIRNRHWAGIIIGGLIVAVLNIIYAIILAIQARYISMGALKKAIASGVLGAAAFKDEIAVIVVFTKHFYLIPLRSPRLCASISVPDSILPITSL